MREVLLKALFTRDLLQLYLHHLQLQLRDLLVRLVKPALENLHFLFDQSVETRVIYNYHSTIQQGVSNMYGDINFWKFYLALKSVDLISHLHMTVIYLLNQYHEMFKPTNISHVAVAYPVFV